MMNERASRDKNEPSSVKSLRLPSALLPQIQTIVEEHGYASANAFMLQAIMDAIAKQGQAEEDTQARAMVAQVLRRQALLHREMLTKVGDLMRLNETLMVELNEKLASVLETVSPQEQIRISEECETLIESSEAALREGGRRHRMVNTNYSHDPTDHAYMLRKGVVAAFFSPWKEKIQKHIDIGDIVYLYQSGVGIVAYGRVAAKPRLKGLEKNSTIIEEIFAPLDDFICLSNPIPPSKIRKIMNYDVPFRHTLVRLPNVAGELLYQYLETVV